MQLLLKRQESLNGQALIEILTKEVVIQGGSAGFDRTACVRMVAVTSTYGCATLGYVAHLCVKEKKGCY